MGFVVGSLYRLYTLQLLRQESICISAQAGELQEDFILFLLKQEQQEQQQQANSQ